MTQFEKLDLLLRECGGTIQTFQVLNNGIPRLASQSDGGRLNPINNSFERIRSTKY